jgi:hypothetical protein
MSKNIILIIAGVVIFLVGLAKQRGVKLSNFGIKIGSTNTQSIDVGNGSPDVGQSQKRDWTGLWIAFVYFFPAPGPNPSPSRKRIEADCGSVAIGGDVSGATITAGGNGDCPKPGL